MYGLPKNFDGSFLVGLTLEMVCFSANQVYLHFNNHVMITIEGKFLHQLNDFDNTSRPASFPISQSRLMQLLEHDVAKASGEKDGTLIIIFDNGQIIKCFDTPQYESYKIKNGEKVTIV